MYMNKTNYHELLFLADEANLSMGPSKLVKMLGHLGKFACFIPLKFFAIFQGRYQRYYWLINIKRLVEIQIWISGLLIV